MMSLAISLYTHGALSVICLLGFACLALAMDRHQETIFVRTLRLSLTQGLRVSGCLLLMLSLCVAVFVLGWGLGITVFIAHSSAAAGLIFMLLVLAHRRSRR